MNWLAVSDEDPVELETNRQFWLGVLYAGIAGYIAVSAGTAAYLEVADLKIPGGVVSIIALGLVFAAINYVLRKQIVNARPAPRLAVFALWSALSFLLLDGLCALDGGVASPLSALLIIPMLFLAIGYPVTLVIVNGLFGLACYAVLVLITPAPVPWLYVLLQGLALGIGWVLALLGAGNWARQSAATRTRREQLKAASVTDELTGCLNQRAFYAELTREIERAVRYRHPLTLMIIDIDYFKSINGRYGHLTGDNILRHVGGVILGIARESDIAGRPGGDELALLAPETDRDAAVALAERLRHRLTAPAASVDITVSIGICADLRATDDASSLYQRADRSLYAAKHFGRNQFVCSDDAQVAEIIFDGDREWGKHVDSVADYATVTSESGESSTYSDQWQSCEEVDGGINQGLRDQRFFVVYQPIIDAATGVISRFEALARWNHPSRGIVQPSLFIPIAEQSGRIIELGRCILDTAVAQAAEWEREGRGVLVSVNVAALQVSGPMLAKDIQDVLTRHRLSPRLLEIELTETALLPYLDDSASPLDAVKKLGVSLSLDDFGTGYSSLNYLSRLPIDRIKIDRSFVARLEHIKDQRILENLINMCRALDLKVTAEGIETETQAATLKALGCDEWQGFYFSHPKTADRIEWRQWDVSALQSPAPEPELTSFQIRR